MTRKLPQKTNICDAMKVAFDTGQCCPKVFGKSKLKESFMYSRIRRKSVLTYLSLQLSTRGGGFPTVLPPSLQGHGIRVFHSGGRG